MRRYWDTCCFLGVLNEEPDKLGPCKAVIREAQNGHVRIVTSALTLTEVLWQKGEPLPLPASSAEKVQKLFLHEWITVYDLDRALAERAREAVWNNSVRVKDAIHVVTAIDAKVDQFDTYDRELIDLSGKVGNPPLVIGEPNIPMTLLDELETEEDESEETA